MNTICFYAVPKFSDSSLKPEVFYKLDGFASADNPLSRFGRSRKLDKRDLLYVIRNAREISLSFNDALVRYYFDQSIGMISDHVTLTDAELIREYDSLKSEHQADSEEFLRACYEISLKQKQLDLKMM